MAQPPRKRTNSGNRPRPSGGNSNWNRPQAGGPRGGGRPQVVQPEPEEDSKEEAIEVEGVIVAVLAGTMFRVSINQGKHQVLAHISGKMRKKFIKLVIGDRVKMEMSPYDMTKARITYRL